MRAPAIFSSRSLRYPPGPKGTPLLGQLLAYHRDPLGLLRTLALDYGDVAHFKLGPQHMVLVNHPDLIKDVLVTRHANFVKGRSMQFAKRVLGEGLLTSEGDFHLRQRRLIEPAFHHQRIAAYSSIMAQYSARTAEGWPEGGVVDITHEMMRLTLAIVAKTLFDADLESESDEIGQALLDSVRFLNTAMLPLFSLVTRLPSPGARRFQRARTRLDSTIFRLIAERRDSGEDRGDLLSMMLLAADVDGSASGMTAMQIHDEAITILLTGHETMASAMTWALYALSQLPHEEGRLHAELDEVLAGRTATISDLPRLPRLRMILSESLRQYPPAWAVARRALHSFEIASYLVPANSIVLLSPYVTHHDPRYFPDPFRFDSDRWTAEAQAERPRFAYFPFGGGIRQCVGEGFAWTEGALILATIAQRWRMRLASGHRVGIRPLAALRPTEGMPMRLERRCRPEM
jgi:cytochrome P450